MHRIRQVVLRSAVAFLLWITLASLGCATTTATPKTITSVQQLVGSWNGWIGCHGCPIRFRASLSVREDGYWTMITEQNPSFHGKFAIVNGDLQWGREGWWVGPVAVVEEGGREYLTIFRANGDVWTEFDRPK